MRFRLKITLCMVCLLSLLFGAGSSALLVISFQTALERETAAARESQQMLLGTLQVVNQAEIWQDGKDVPEALGRLTARGNFSWSALKLLSGEQVLYSQGEAAEELLNRSGQVDTEHGLISYFNDKEGRPYLQLTAALQIGKDTLYLDTGYDISGLYETRLRQQKEYSRIFLILLFLCGVLSYSTAWLLSRPLAKLSRASREIASGNLSYRSNVRSRDEFGELSGDFDNMAGQVERSIESLKEGARRQEEFMGNFVHELKTPMTAVIGYADLLRSQELSEQERMDAANYIFSESRRLESLSLKLLDIFVADRKEVKLIPASPSILVKEITGYLRPLWEREELSVTCRCEEGVCLMEPDLVQSLLTNLLENARKALSKGGSVLVEVRMLADGCSIRVTDNGKGIPEEALGRLTEAFYRVDKSRSRAQGSAGLGLALCEKIVRLHHGSLTFASRPEQGTRVTAELRGGRV